MNQDIAKAQLLANVIRHEFCLENAGVEKVYLFGSRARGEAMPGSDWDFLVITTSALERTLKKKVASKIRLRLAFEYDLSADILVWPSSMIPEIKKDRGRVSYTGLAEGIPV